MHTEKTKPHLRLTDERGSFTSILNRGEWKEINWVESKQGAIRGNHYHKHTIEYIYLLSGEAEVRLQPLNQAAQTLRILPGEGIFIHPFTYHTFIFSQDSTHLALLSEVFTDENPDLHVLEL